MFIYKKKTRNFNNCVFSTIIDGYKYIYYQVVNV